MSSVFPTAIDSFVNPQPTDQVDVVPHAQQHANANDAIVAIESYLKNGSATGPTDNIVISGPGADSGTSNLTLGSTSSVVRIERDGQVQYVTVSPTNTPISVTINGETITLTRNDGPPPYISYSTTGGAWNLGVTGYDGQTPGSGAYGFKTFTGTMNGTTEVINDVDVLATSPLYVTYGAQPIGNIIATATAGTITLTSTGTEVALPYTIVLFASQTQNFSNPTFGVSDAVYGPSWDGDTLNAPSKNAVYDKIESMGAGAPVNPSNFLLDANFSFATFTHLNAKVATGNSESVVIGTTDDINYIPKLTQMDNNFNTNYYIHICDVSGGVISKTISTSQIIAQSSPDTNRTLNTFYGLPMVYNGNVYMCAKTNTAYTVYKANITSDISVIGNWNTNYTVSGYTLNAADSFVGTNGTYIYLWRTGTTSVRRFQDNGTTLTYIDTITLPAVYSNVYVNDNFIYYVNSGRTIAIDATTHAVIGIKSGGVGLTHKKSLYTLTYSIGLYYDSRQNVIILQRAY